jgi:hypothetical protein
MQSPAPTQIVAACLVLAAIAVVIVAIAHASRPGVSRSKPVKIESKSKCHEINKGQLRSDKIYLCRTSAVGDREEAEIMTIAAKLVDRTPPEKITMIYGVNGVDGANCDVFVWDSKRKKSVRILAKTKETLGGTVCDHNLSGLDNLSHCSIGCKIQVVDKKGKKGKKWLPLYVRRNPNGNFARTKCLRDTGNEMECTEEQLIDRAPPRSRAFHYKWEKFVDEKFKMTLESEDHYAYKLTQYAADPNRSWTTMWS